MKKVLFASFILSLLAISCGKDKNTPVNPGADAYMSITANSKWIYDVITNPGPGQTVAADTVTATSTDTSINLSGASRSYRIFKHSGGASDYYNISGNDYYRYQQIDLNGTFLNIEDLYLKDNQALNASWSQNVNLSFPGFPFPIALTITNTIIEKGGSKTVNGIAYTDVITIRTDITGAGLPAGTITTNIKSYYARKVGLIQGDYMVQIPAASVDINNQTLLKSATIQ
jgi:hypothetical protein